MYKLRAVTEKKYGINLNEFEPATLPYYTCTPQGVFYHAFDTDKHGSITEKPPLRLSDSIRLTGRGTDEAGNYYRIIEWKDRLTQEPRRAALPMADIGSCWGRLQGMGIAVQSNRRKRELLSDYLQTEGQQNPCFVSGRAGWCKDAYILPGGEILTSDKDTPRIIYNGDKSQAPYYTQAGSLREWQQHIARYCTGNSRLCLAVGAAFAAPLMRLLDIEGGGFHLYGDSSDGKTTTAKIALSVWGKPDDLKLSWEGTGHGFTNIANACNDNLLILDEIGQAAPRVVAHTAYSVINGTGKIQGHKDGGNREINRWRVLALSTGEKDLRGYLKNSGAEWQAGQATRLPAIPANAGKNYGVFDTLHDFDHPALLAEYLNSAVNRYYGCAGRAFIAALLKDKEAAIAQANQIMRAFNDTLPELSGQARRVGNRFALVAAALEAAAQYGITGMAAGAASHAVKQCFDDWYASNNGDKYEDRQIIEQAEAFMQQHAESLRFAYWQENQTAQNHAGYRRYNLRELQQQNSRQGRKLEEDELCILQEYWIIPAVFKDEICRGFDAGKVCSVLHHIGWLKRYESQSVNRWQHQRKGKGWYYVLTGTEPPDLNTHTH